MNRNSYGKIVPTDNEGEIVLGPQLTNPYTTTNMIAAATAIQSQGYTYLTPSQISATHLYVKFAPSDSEQYETLASDTNMVIYDYPLDREITASGNMYHDPSLSPDVPTYQYASVDIGFNFPVGISYTILDSLYIPEEDPRIDDDDQIQDEFRDKLLDKAYTLTGNYSDTVKTTAKVTASSFRPSGKIRIKDTRVGGLIGLEGVQVRARRWFTTIVARTDFNGDYLMFGRFKRDCNYSIWFASLHFSVRKNWVATTAWIDGPKLSGAWNYDIMDGTNRFLGHIFRGAQRYHYGDIGGLKRPWRASGARNIIIGKDLIGKPGKNLGIISWMRIGRYRFPSVEYQSDDIFSITVHELCHTSHINLMGGIPLYLGISTQLRESWCVGVEWYITQLEYQGTRGIPTYGTQYYNPSPSPIYPARFGYQDWTTTTDPDYTNMYIDLIDYFNENDNSTTTPNDQVHGYDMPSVEAFVVPGAFTLGTLKSRLKLSKPFGISDGDIDLLISVY